MEHLVMTPGVVCMSVWNKTNRNGQMKWTIISITADTSLRPVGKFFLMWSSTFIIGCCRFGLKASAAQSVNVKVSGDSESGKDKLVLYRSLWRFSRFVLLFLLRVWGQRVSPAGANYQRRAQGHFSVMDEQTAALEPESFTWNALTPLCRRPRCSLLLLSRRSL